MKYICFLLLLSKDSQTHAQFVLPSLDVYAVTAYHSEPPPFSPHSNKASLSRNGTWTARLYSDRPYLVQDLANFFASMSLPSRYGNWGVQLGYSGTPSYKLTSLGAGYSKNLHKTDMALFVNYFNNTIPGYFAQHTLSADLALQYRVNEALIMGVQAGNMAVGGKGGVYKMQQYSMGGGYRIGPYCFVGLEMVRKGQGGAYMQGLFHYKFNAKMQAWIGYHSGNGSATGGASWALKDFSIEMHIAFHPYLGLTPGVGLVKMNQE